MRTRIHHLLEEAAAAAPGAPAVSVGDEVVGYDALLDEVRRVAAGLGALGLDRGARVAIHLDKRRETVVAMLAASVAGLVFVPVNPVLRPLQVGHVIADSGARVLVTTEQRWTAHVGEAGALGDLAHVVLVGSNSPSSDAGWTTPVPTAPWSALVGAPIALPTGRGPDGDVAAILYTSGSTGLPKGVVLSHRNMLVGAESVSSYLELSADDVILAALPLSFDAGLSQITTAFCVGAHVVLANYLLPRDLVRLCARHSITGITGVPPLWGQLAGQEWPAEATRGLRWFANTGGRMPRAVLDRLREHFPAARPYLMYGLTEAFRSTYLDPSEVDRRPDSIGRAIPDAEVLVLREDGTECDVDEVGELVHRGPLVALGYHNDAERTAERFRELPGRPDWAAPERAVFSGDKVRRDADGFLYFVGRGDEMLKTSGYRVSPTEIEEAAFATGLVADAVAVGLPDELLGHRIVLVVARSQAEDGASLDEQSMDGADVVAALRRTLPRYMVPAAVVVRSELPRSPNGKYDRVAIAASMQERVSA